MRRNLIWLIVISLLSACGTGVGNPDIQSTLDGVGDFPFEDIVSEYQTYRLEIQGIGTDCGSFDEFSSTASIEMGKSCMQVSLTSCTSAAYLLDQENANGSRVTSFVSVIPVNGTCVARVYTASTDATVYYGSFQSYCDDLSSPKGIEFACAHPR